MYLSVVTTFVIISNRLLAGLEGLDLRIAAWSVPGKWLQKIELLLPVEFLNFSSLFVSFKEGMLPALQKLVHDDADAPDVDRRAVALVGNDLGCHVAHCPASIL